MPPPLFVFDIWIGYSQYRQMHRHSFHEFFLALEGSGEQFTPEGSLKMKQGDIFFFPAGVEHIGNGSEAGDCLGGVINVADEFFLGEASLNSDSREVLASLGNWVPTRDYRVNVNSAGRQQLFAIFSKMLEEARAKRAGYQSMVGALVHQFLIAILRNSQLNIRVDATTTTPVAAAQINDTIRFIQAHFADQIGIDQAAQMSNMSRSYFHASFREVTGQTFVQFLTNLRVQNAAHLLRTTELETQTVAFRSGFTSVSHFYKVFKDATGTTPRKVRARSGKNASELANRARGHRIGTLTAENAKKDGD